MPRYIDADKFTERIKVSPAFCNINDGLLLQRVVIDLLNNAPAADVVPKSEVEELKKAYANYEETTGLKKAKQEVAREIFEEIEEYAELQIESLNIAEKVDLSGADFFGGGKQAFVLLLDRLAELKKKYTKGQENQ